MQTAEVSWYTKLAFATIHPSKYTILVIDDDREQRSLIKKYLAREGYNVLTTHSADEGIALMQERFVSLVITDLRMPDMDGFEFIKQVRALPPIPRRDWLPIIMLTSCDQNLALAALEIGADMYCLKKQLKEHLLTQIEFLLT